MDENQVRWGGIDFSCCKCSQTSVKVLVVFHSEPILVIICASLVLALSATTSAKISDHFGAWDEQAHWSDLG
jgi:hypothetical protein